MEPLPIGLARRTEIISARVLQTLSGTVSIATPMRQSIIRRATVLQCSGGSSACKITDHDSSGEYSSYVKSHGYACETVHTCTKANGNVKYNSTVLVRLTRMRGSSLSRLTQACDHVQRKFCEWQGFRA